MELLTHLALRSSRDGGEVRRARSATDPRWSLDPASAGVGTIRCVVGLGDGDEPWWAVGGTNGFAWVRHDGDDVTIERFEIATVTAIAAHPRGARVAVGDLGGSIHLLTPPADTTPDTTNDAASAGHPDGAPSNVGRNELTGYPDRVALLAWSTDGRHLFAVADDDLTAWPADAHGRIDAPEPLQFVGHDEAITAIAVHPSRPVIATLDAIGSIVLWTPTQDSIPIASLHRPIGSEAIDAAWRDDGSTLTVSTADGRVHDVAVSFGLIA